MPRATAPTLGLLLAILAPVSLAYAQDARTALLGADRQASQVSSDSGIASALRSALHPTGILLWPGAPVIAGAEDLEHFLQLRPTRDSLRLTWQPLGMELARDSTLGVTWGIAVSTWRPAAGSPRLGRYISAWRRDGQKWNVAALALIGIESPTSTERFTGLPVFFNDAGPT